MVGVTSHEAIAVIGMGCRFPGGASNPDQFWMLLQEGRDAIVDVPEDRWSVKNFYDPDRDKPGKSYVKRGGFLKESLKEFDAQFFGISTREAAILDPQQRLLLEVSWEALEDSGLAAEALRGSHTGVYIGGFTLDNQIQQFSPFSRASITTHTAVSSSMTMLSNRLSYTFDFRGPSVSVDTACSSSLVSLHLACQGLLNQECDLALSGGVNVMLRPEYFITMCKGGFLSPDGLCKTFDSSADGYGRGEGAGIVVLKRLSEALRDGDAIHAVIAASGMNQDGHTQGITLPSGEAQQALIKQVVAKAGILPHQIQYVEAHGTGTKAGDPIEANSLGALYGQGRADGDYCFVGSVKTNVGHLEAAAGIAGFLKTVLAIKNRAIPAHLHLQTPNPAIDFEALHLRIPRQLERWPQHQGLMAAVNSFGYGGTNAHVIVTEAPEPICHAVKSDKRMFIVPISAGSETALNSRAVQIADQLAQGQPIEDVAYTLAVHRSYLPHRLAVIASNSTTFVSATDAYLADQTTNQIATGHIHKNQDKGVAFVYTGMGAQWWGMGQELIEQEPVFRHTVERFDAVWQPLANWSLFTLFADANGTPMTDPEFSQPANLVLQVALTELLASYGVYPQAVIGHSVGELAAAYVAGSLSLNDVIHLTYYRSQLQQQTAGVGTMLAVGLSVNDVQTYLSPLVSVAAINSPVSTTLAGDSDALRDISERLSSKDIFSRFLHVGAAYHSYQMEPFAEEFLGTVQDITPHIPYLSLYSTVTGCRVDAEEQTADYWWRNVRQPVLLSDALRGMFQDGYRAFLEIGPNPVLSQSIKDCMQDCGVEGITLASLKRKQPEMQSVLLAVADLYTHGLPVDWHRAYPDGHSVALPPYPWDKEVVWQETDEAQAERLGVKSEHPLIERLLGVPDAAWQGELNPTHHPYLRDHKIQDMTIFPGAGFVEIGLAVAAQNNSKVLEDVEFQRALIIDKTPVVQFKLAPDGKGFTVYSRPLDNLSDWTMNGTGRIVNGVFPAYQIDLEAIKARCDVEHDVNEVYERMNRRGLQYGAHFRAMQKLWSGDDETLTYIVPNAEICLDGYLLHPTILDAGFQSLIALLGSTGQNTYLPVKIDRVCLYHSYDQAVETGVWCHAVLKRKLRDGVIGDVLLCDNAGNVLAEVRGLWLKAVNHAAMSHDYFYDLQWEAAEPLAIDTQLSGRWLLFVDNNGVAEAVAQQLKRHQFVRVTAGDSFKAISSHQFQIRPDSADDMAQLVEAAGHLNGSLYCWGMATEADSKVADPVGLDEGVTLLNLVQSLTRTATTQWKRLCVITSGLWDGQLSDQTDHKIRGVGQSVLWGIQRVVANEHPELKPLCVDVKSGNTSISQLAAEVTSTTDEQEVALRDGKRYVARLNRVSTVNEQHAIAETATRYMLKVRKPGLLDSLAFQETQRVPPGAGEVEVKVYISAVNFKDIMKVMGMLPERYLDSTYFGSELGLECAGIITAIGEGVTHLNVGDPIVFPDPKGSFRSYTTVPVDFIVPKPTRFTFEESTFITNWVAPYYGLHEIARLQAGERVLIHAATGGVGLAAIQIAQWKGAEIYATAGSDEKRDYLRSLGIRYVSDSRSLKFVNDIREWTNGEGVDVVLNSLSGEALTHSFDLLAPFGRFVEIGKRDITENRALAMAAFDRNLTFAAVDVDKMMVERPGLFRRLQLEVWELTENGIFNPLPTIVYPATEIKEAFRFMREAKHIGKVVINMDNQPVEYQPMTAAPIGIKPNSTYLITGGTAGFGLQAARWLVEQGATHLVLASRRGSASDEAQTVLQQLADRGVEVLLTATDVSDEAQVAALVEQIRDSMPPLRGVIHSAMVLDDAVLTRLNHERFERVMAPKALGAWNLHQHTLDMPLDFFVMFSSISSLIGNAGQANYVAANAFLDSLAHYRRSNGLPATSINWGALKEVGVVSRHPEVEQHLQQLGIEGFALADALTILEEVFRRNPVQVAAANINWKTWAANSYSTSPRYQHLIAHDGSTSSGNKFIDQLCLLPRAEQKEFAQNFILEHVAKVLRTSVSRLDVQTGLDKFGIDSLMAVELSAAIRLETTVQFSTVLMMRGPTVEQLASELITQLVSEEDDLLNAVEEMSESELDALLMQLLPE